MKTRNLFLAFFICITLTAITQTIIPAGNVSGNWTIEGSPYLIQGHIIIPDGSELTIDPGVTVEFTGHYKLFVNGCIRAIGTTTESVVFTATNPTTGWWGIRLDNTPVTNDSSIICYCRLKYGTTIGSSGDDSHGGAVFLKNFSKIRISHCIIENNNANEGGGIYCEASSPIISGNNISNNTGGAISCNFSSSPIITRNIISNNTYVSGSGIYCYISSPVITNNIIYHNISYYFGGGIYCYTDSSPLIENNFICNNSTSGENGVNGHGGGIFCETNSSPEIIGNVISNNSAFDNGGGIYCSTNSSPTIFNCHITNNLANEISDGGGGLYCTNNSNPVLKNVILYGNVANSGNGNQVYLDDNASDPSFEYCNVQGNSSAFYTNGNPYTGTYIFNIDNDPLFVLPSSGPGPGFDGLSANWSLQELSLCIDAGTPETSGLNLPPEDLVDSLRISGDICIVDIGAFEYQNGICSFTRLAEVNYNKRINVFPNPSNGKFRIEPEDKIACTNKFIEIYNVMGERVYAKPCLTQQESNLIDLTGSPKGIYLVKFFDGNEINSEKILIQ